MPLKPVTVPLAAQIQALGRQAENFQLLKCHPCEQKGENMYCKTILGPGAYDINGRKGLPDIIETTFGGELKKSGNVHCAYCKENADKMSEWDAQPPHDLSRIFPEKDRAAIRTAQTRLTATVAAPSAQAMTTAAAVGSGGNGNGGSAAAAGAASVSGIGQQQGHQAMQQQLENAVAKIDKIDADTMAMKADTREMKTTIDGLAADTRLELNAIVLAQNKMWADMHAMDMASKFAIAADMHTMMGSVAADMLAMNKMQTDITINLKTMNTAVEWMAGDMKARRGVDAQMQAAMDGIAANSDWDSQAKTIEDGMHAMKTTMAGMAADMQCTMHAMNASQVDTQTMGTEVKGMKADMDVILSSIDEHNERMKNAMKKSMDDLRADMGGMKADMSGMKADMKAMEPNEDAMKTTLDGMATAIETSIGCMAADTQCNMHAIKACLADTHAMRNNMDDMAADMHAIPTMNAEIEAMKAQMEHMWVDICNMPPKIKTEMDGMGMAADMKDGMADMKTTMADGMASHMQAIKTIQADMQAMKTAMDDNTAADMQVMKTIEANVQKVKTAVDATAFDTESMMGGMTAAMNSLAANGKGDLKETLVAMFKMAAHMNTVRADIEEYKEQNKQGMAALKKALEDMA